jgi:thiol-disulfide isomerase/thioredoxin
LGLILTGAALRGANVQTSLLLFAYAAGSGVSLAAALLLGGRALASLKRALHAEQWVRRALGGAVVAGSLAIALGLDTGLLARISTASTTQLEETLLRLMPGRGQDEDGVLLPSSAIAGGAMMSGNSPAMTSAASVGSAPAPMRMPSLDGATQWLNSAPLTAGDLRGKVVLIDFWTYSCINCIRALPYVRAWDEKYRKSGLVVIGIHSPEFAFEKNLRNVEREVRDLRITYPVAVDNEYALWRAFANQYWPAHYFVDAMGVIRHTHFGEGGYDVSERVLQQLLAEAGQPFSTGAAAAAELVTAEGEGAALPSDEWSVLSPETYIGHGRAESFVSPGGQVPGAEHDYTAPERLGLNDWALAGNWTVGDDDAVLNSATGRILFRFQARDLHLVLGSRDGDGPIRFRVRVDGAPPGNDRGGDVDAAGEGTVTEQRLYQLIRQSGEVRDRLFEIEFLDPNVMAYAFTFG